MNYRLAISLVLCSLAFAALDAKAEGLKPTAFGLHLQSAHFPAKDSHENRNRGFYVRGESYQVGAYTNTYGRDTFYAAYVHKLGPVDLLVGAASGYAKKCNTYSVKTGEKLHITKHKGEYSKTTTPVYEQRESCAGFSRGYLTPMAGLSIASPWSVLGATPVLFAAPGFGKAASVLHISVQWSI